MTLQEVLIYILLSVSVGDGQQIMYSRAVPLEAIYGSRRIVPRNIPEENVPIRVHPSFEHYFPQVETQAASAPAQPYLRLTAPAPAAALLPQSSPYRPISQSLYALPSQWAEGTIIQHDPSRRDDYDYGVGYEYDEELNPPYPSYDGDMYVQGQSYTDEDMMVNYLLNELRSRPRDPMEFLDIQRRNQDNGMRMVPIPIASIIHANSKQNESQSMPASPTVLPTPPPTDDVSGTPSLVKSSLPPPYSSTHPPATAPLNHPSSNRANDPSESRLSRAQSDSQGTQDMWTSFSSAERGQKEFPLYRPPKINHQSAWSALEEQLSRAKDSSHKSAIPLLKKLIGSHHTDDPLTNQLTNLKFHKL